MKKIFILFVLLLISVPVLALNIEVEAMSDFSTNNPPKVYSVKIVEPIDTDKFYIEAGSVVEGKIEVKDAKRLKMDATFTFTPITLTTPDGKVLHAKKDHTGKYKKEVNKGKIAKTVALSAGNFVVKGFSTGYSAVEGMIKNEEGNRLKSSVVAVYKGSPLSYVEKGNALKIKQGEHFFISFKTDDNDNEDDK